MKRLLMLIGVAAMTAMAAPAQADPPPNDDADFLKQVMDAGLSFKDPVEAVTVAKSICDLAKKGTSEDDIKKNLEQQNSFSGVGATKFIYLSAAEYCPSQLESEPPKA